MEKRLENLIESVTQKILLEIKSGKLSTGINGPYNDKETELRALAHSINIIRYDVSISDTLRRKEIKNLAYRIINSEHYKGGAYFVCRNKKDKDQVNGVIGVAWILEGLAVAYDYLKDEEIKEFIKVVIQSLKFDKENYLWIRPTIKEDSTATIDKTFNHQLWLAYALAYCNYVTGEAISKDVFRFLENIESKINIYKDGLIKHYARKNETLAGKIKFLLRDVKKRINCIIYNLDGRYKEIGYHLFNVYAFARLKQLGYEKYFYEKKWFLKIMDFTSSNYLFDKLLINNDSRDYYKIDSKSVCNCNRYGFPYNVSGFEFYYISKVFNLKSKNVQKYLEYQLNFYNMGEKKLLSEDPINMRYRVYELLAKVDHEA